MNDGPNEWNRLGSSEPYFSVLTESRFLSENLTPEALADFYATGENDVARIAALASVVTRRPFSPTRVLEFGCGVGRMTFAMARRAGLVVGVDAAQSMLAIGKAEAQRREVRNVRFVSVDEMASLQDGSFDFIFSLIVFQHIPVADGERFLRGLLPLAAPTSTIALEFAFTRPGGRLRKMLRAARARSGLIHRLATFARGERDLPYMQMNTYDRARIESILAAEGFERPLVEATDHGGIEGGIIVATRSDAG